MRGRRWFRRRGIFAQSAKQQWRRLCGKSGSRGLKGRRRGRSSSRSSWWRRRWMGMLNRGGGIRELEQSDGCLDELKKERSLGEKFKRKAHHVGDESITALH